MPRKSNTEEVVYNHVCEHPGESTYSIAKHLRMTGGRVRHTLSNLKQKGLIKFKVVRQSPRIRKLSYAVDAFSLLPQGLKKQLKRVKV